MSINLIGADYKCRRLEHTMIHRLAIWQRLGTVLFIVSCLGVAHDAPAVERPPNIIFILADDLGRGHCGCYGQTKIRTPNIDRLAKEGMKFNQFYAGANVCAPSRSVLMTGLHTGHT